MIKPQDAVFLYQPSTEERLGMLVVMDIDRRHGEYFKSWPCSWGAVFSAWRKLSDDEVYECMHWLALEVSEFAGVPMRMIRDQMQENVDGYTQYAARIGRMATSRTEK